VELRPDEAWREKMKWSERAVVTILTRPLLSRYGYTSTNERSAVKKG
jgi:hypothetical protein